MPGQGLIPARGDWEYRWFDMLSTATFKKGSGVNFNAAYQVREYLSTDSQLVGIAMSDAASARTLAAGRLQVLVALPRPACTAYSDVTTGVNQSDLSVGKHVALYKEGNITSYASTVMGQSSRFSSTLVIIGNLDSLRSRVEVGFSMENLGFYSTSSNTYAS